MRHSIQVAYLIPGPIIPRVDYPSPRTGELLNLSFAMNSKGIYLEVHGSVHYLVEKGTLYKFPSFFSLWLHFLSPISLFTSQMGRAR